MTDTLRDQSTCQSDSCCSASPIASVGTIRDQVRQTYSEAALISQRKVTQNVGTAEFANRHYSEDEMSVLPAAAAEAARGCGNPLLVADLQPGERVLDLGSGGGIDVLLSARRVGPDGYVYGLDMTEEMLELARANAAEAGVENVEFRFGFMEEIPLPDQSVDVVISNCVINLSDNKAAVFREMARVLATGGRLGIYDVVAENGMSRQERLERGSWVGCIAGALTFTEYRQGLTKAGFTDVEITSTHLETEGMHSCIIKARRP